VQPEGDDDEEDPRWELIRQLVEYKKFKDAAAQLAVLELRQDDVFPRRPGKIEFGPEGPARSEASVFDLVNAVNNVLKRFTKRDDPREIFEDKWSVSEKIEILLKEISERTRMKFSDLFVAVTTRSEVVVTFLALLELIRLKQLAAVQPEPFGEIEICRAVPPLVAIEPMEPAPAAPSPAPDTPPNP